MRKVLFSVFSYNNKLYVLVQDESARKENGTSLFFWYDVFVGMFQDMKRRVAAFDMRTRAESEPPYIMLFDLHAIGFSKIIDIIKDYYGDDCEIIDYNDKFIEKNYNKHCEWDFLDN